MGPLPFAGSGPHATQRQRYDYNQSPSYSSKVKTKVMTITEMAITRLAATAVSQRSRFSGSIRSSKLHHSFAAPHLELTHVTHRGNLTTPQLRTSLNRSLTTDLLPTSTNQ